MATTIDWPDDVNKCLALNTYVEERQPQAIRSPVDAGPAKMRRRYTRPVTGIAGSIVMTREEVGKFWQFFDITLQGGILSFNFENPVSQKTEEMRFLQPPRLVPVTDDTFNMELIVEQF